MSEKRPDEEMERLPSEAELVEMNERERRTALRKIERAKAAAKAKAKAEAAGDAPEGLSDDEVEGMDEADGAAAPSAPPPPVAPSRPPTQLADTPELAAS